VSGGYDRPSVAVLDPPENQSEIAEEEEAVAGPWMRIVTMEERVGVQLVHIVCRCRMWDILQRSRR